MNLDKRSIKNPDIEIALNKILSEESPFYSTMWDSLTHHQRNVLQAIAVYGGHLYRDIIHFTIIFLKLSNLFPSFYISAYCSAVYRVLLIQAIPFLSKVIYVSYNS